MNYKKKVNFVKYRKNVLIIYSCFFNYKLK